MDYKIKDGSRVLVVDLGGVGDILLSTPALRALKNTFPGISLSIMVVPRARELAASLPYIDEVFSFDIRVASLINDALTLFKLRKKKFDLAINMRTLVSEDSAKKVRLLFDIIDPRVKAGRDTDGRGSFFDIKIPETAIGQKPEMEYYIDLVTKLGARVADRSIDFEIKDEETERVTRMLRDMGIGAEDKLICVHPGGRPSHRWPLKNFARVINELRKAGHYKFVITGDNSEEGLAAALAREGDRDIINLAGKLNIKELGALIKRCGLIISNDTGPIHMAAILDTPVIALFGPGDIVRFNPRNISEKAVTLRDLSGISPYDVLKAALEILGREKGQAA